MSILIEGMEMPKVGRAFAIAIHPDGTITSWTGRDMPQYEAIPISPHGDLIDRDALISQCKDEKGCYYGHDSAVIGEAVESAPTVIPANREATK